MPPDFGWTIVEAMVPREMTVIAHGGQPKAWRSLRRVVQPSIRLEQTVRAVLESGRAIDTELRGAGGRRFQIVALPLMGPDDECYGAQLWCAPLEVPVPAARIASCISWELGTQTIHQTADATAMSGVRPQDHVPTRTTAEYYSKAIRFDDLEGLFSIGFDPAPGKRWDGGFTVLHADGHAMSWHTHAKACSGPCGPGLRAIWHDITDLTPPTKPPLSEAVLGRALRGTGQYTALFETRLGVLTIWLSPEEPEWVAWRNIQAQNQPIHPEDLDLLRSVNAVLHSGTAENVLLPVRFRSITDEWITVDTRVLPYAGPLSERFVILHIDARSGHPYTVRDTPSPSACSHPGADIG